MKRQRITTALFCFAILISGILTGNGYAFAPPHHRGGCLGLRGLMTLDLSDSQKAEVGGVIDKYREEGKALVDSLFEARENSRAAMQAEPFDEEKVRQAFQQISPILEDLMVLKAKVMAEVRPLLTADQLELLNQQWSQRCERMRHGKRFGESMVDAWLQTKTD